jgi:hypothetical protein
LREGILTVVGFGLVWAFLQLVDPKTYGDGSDDPFEGLDL